MIKDLTGKRFGRWKVIRIAGRTSLQSVTFLCRCDCGKEKVIVGSSLRFGDSTSCGCYQKETVTKDGESHTYIHKSWRAMISRCINVNHQNYHNYGGRGIKVCKRWYTFKNFKKDMGERPSSRHSIDRINNDGDYKPSNCRWATQKEQSNNRRNNKYITYKGQKKTLSQWAEKLGMTCSGIRYRLSQGWSAEDIIEKKKQNYKKKQNI